eukprot:scaffold82281_cov53-Phaeocystis_antarctica.AAC.2
MHAGRGVEGGRALPPAERGRRGLELAELHVAHLGHALGALLLGQRVRVELDHLLDEVEPLGRLAHVRLEEGARNARAELDVHDARLEIRGREVLYVQQRQGVALDRVVAVRGEGLEQLLLVRLDRGVGLPLVAPCR